MATAFGLPIPTPKRPKPTVQPAPVVGATPAIPTMAAPAPSPAPLPSAPLAPDGVSSGRPAEASTVPPAPLAAGAMAGIAASLPKPPTPQAPSSSQPKFIQDAIDKARQKAEEKFREMTTPAAPRPYTPAPAAAVGSDGYTDAQRAEAEAAAAAANTQKLGEIASVDQTQVVPPAPVPPAPVPPAPVPPAPVVTPPAEVLPLGSEATMNDAPVQPEAPVVTPAADAPVDPNTLLQPQPTDAPEVVQGKTQAQQDLDFITGIYRQWATTKDDPSMKAARTQAMLDFGMQSQGAADALQMRINRDPSLAGQGAGNALLSMMGSQLGMQKADLLANLTIAEADRVRQLNQLGVDGLYKLTREKMSDDEKSTEFYGNIIDRLVSTGDPAQLAQAQEIFNSKVLPLLGDKGEGMTFDMFRSPAERQKLITGAENEMNLAFREAVDAGNLDQALQILESTYSEAIQMERGKKLAEATDVAVINEWLKAAGMEEITAISDLVGREDDVFVAKQMKEALDKINENPQQPRIDALKRTLQGQGFDITDPDVVKAIEDYVYQEDFGDPEGANLFPWDSPATAYKYRDWPVFNPVTGDTVYDGGQIIEDGVQQDSWQQELDTQWERYMRAHPDASERLSRDEWFEKLRADFMAAGKPDMSIDGFISQTGWDAGAKKTDLGDRTLTAAEIRNDIDSLPNAAALAEWVNDAGNIEQAVDSGAIKNFPTTASLPTSTASWDTLLAPTTGTAGGLIQYDGKVYQIEAKGGSAVRNIGGIGDVVVLTDPSTNPPKRYVMKVNGPGKDKDGNILPGEPVGRMVEVGSDNTFRWVPDGAVRDI